MSICELSSAQIDIYKEHTDIEIIYLEQESTLKKSPIKMSFCELCFLLLFKLTHKYLCQKVNL